MIKITVDNNTKVQTTKLP